MAPRWATTVSSLRLLSFFAWSSSEARKPVHNWRSLKSRLTMVGARRGVGLPSKLVENRWGSVQPWSGGWQLTQATVLDFDQRLSQKNCLPSAIFSGVGGLSSGIKAACSCRPSGSFNWGSALGPAPTAATTSIPANHATRVVMWCLQCVLGPGHTRRRGGERQPSGRAGAAASGPTPIFPGDSHTDYRLSPG